MSSLYFYFTGFVSVLCLTMYVVLFYADLKRNLITPVDQQPDSNGFGIWTSTDRTNLNYSFYFVMIAAILFFVNIILLILSGTEFHFTRYKSNMNTKSLEGVMMY